MESSQSSRRAKADEEDFSFRIQSPTANTQIHGPGDQAQNLENKPRANTVDFKAQNKVLNEQKDPTNLEVSLGQSLLIQTPGFTKKNSKATDYNDESSFGRKPQTGFRESSDYSYGILNRQTAGSGQKPDQQKFGPQSIVLSERITNQIDHSIVESSAQNMSINEAYIEESSKQSSVGVARAPPTKPSPEFDTGPQIQLRNQETPNNFPEVVSTHQTVDLNQNRQPTHGPLMTQDTFADDKSDLTYYKREEFKIQSGAAKSESSPKDLAQMPDSAPVQRLATQSRQICTPLGQSNIEEQNEYSQQSEEYQLTQKAPNGYSKFAQTLSPPLFDEQSSGFSPEMMAMEQSETDARLGQTTQKNMVPHVLHSTLGLSLRNATGSELGLTEQASSKVVGFDPTQSDAIHLDSLQEEKSVDWQNKMSSAQGSIFSRANNSAAKPVNQTTEETAKFPINEETKVAITKSQCNKVSEASDSLDYSPEKEDKGQQQSSKIESDGGNIDLYESIDGKICEQSPLQATQDYVDHEFNASQDFQAQERSGMYIIEDQPRHIVSTMPNYDQSEPRENRDNRNQRPIKSFELSNNHNSRQSHAENSLNGRNSLISTSKKDVGSLPKESGIEQYESDEGDGLSKQYYTSSMKHTERTRDNVLVVPGFTSGPDQSFNNSINQRAEDSMAFDTIQVQGQEVSMQHECPPQEQKEDNLVGEEAPEVAIEAQNAAISDHDDSQASIDGPNFDVIGEEFSSKPEQIQPGQQVTRDDFDTSHKIDESSMLAEQLATKIEQEDLYQLPKAFTKRETSPQKLSSRRISQRRWHLQSTRSKQEKEDPTRSSRSPAMKDYRAWKDHKSSNKKSPEGKRVIIRDGQIVIQNTPRDPPTFNDKHQFPIRKANYNQRTVEQMISGMDTLRDSVEMMRRMKTRISKYNQEIVPMAQHFYMARQLQISMQTKSQMHDPETVPTMVNASMNEPYPSDFDDNGNLQSNNSKQALTPDLLIDDSNIATMQDQDGTTLMTETNLPQFLRDVSRPRQKANDSVLVDESANFEVQRISNSNQNLDGSSVGSVTRSKELPDQAHGALKSSAMSGQQARVLDPQQQVKHSCRENSKINIIRQRTQQGRKERTSASSMEHAAQVSTSEYRLKSKDGNKRVKAVNQKPGRQTVPPEVDQEVVQAYSFSQKARWNLNQKSTARSNFYPQDNLSTLLHPESAYPIHNRSPTYLASKLAQNHPPNQRTIVKNRTLGNIYNKQNARNLLAAGQMHQGLSSTVKKRNSHERMREADNDSKFIQDEFSASPRIMTSSQKMKEPGSDRKSVLSQRQFGATQSSQMTSYAPESVKDHSVQVKFQKWLEKGRPSASTVNAGGGGNRRNVHRIISSSQGVPGNASHFNFNPKDHPSHAINEEDLEREQENIKPIPDQKINLSVALKVLNDPGYGLTIEQRKKSLLTHIEENFPEEFLRASQNFDEKKHKSSQDETLVGESNTIFSSIDDFRRNNESSQASRYAVERRPEKILVMNNVESANQGDTFLNQFNAEGDQKAQTLPQISLKHRQMRQSHEAQTRRNKDQQMKFLAISDVQPRAQIGHLSQIYAVPQGKKRNIFLRNNYTKNGRLIDQHIAKTNRLAEMRKSRSPKPAEDFERMAADTNRLKTMNSPDGLSKKSNQYRFVRRANKLSNSNQKPIHSMRQSGGALGSTYRDGDSAAQKSKAAAVSARGKADGSRPVSQISPRDAEVRHQMHKKHVESLEREDTYEHPQISLQMPQGQVDGFPQIQSQQPVSTHAPVLQPAEQAIHQEAQAIDLLQEHEVIESQHSLEMPDLSSVNDKQQVPGEKTVTPPPRQEAALPTGRQANLGESEDLIAQSRKKGSIEKHQNLSVATPETMPAQVSPNVESWANIHENEPQATPADDGIVQQNAREEVDEDEDYEEDDDYYADDKFIYEDMVEDPSSEDPEQKFLKEHAERTALQSELEEGKNEAGPAGQELAADNSLQLMAMENRRVSQSQSNMAESRDKDDLMSRQSNKQASAALEASAKATSRQEVVKADQDKNEDQYSEN